MIRNTDKGTIIYRNGGEYKYEGEWKDNKKHGQGTIISSDGGKYEGEWKDNKKHGKGILTFADGSKHEGEWDLGNKSGQGTMISSDGGKYEGEWKDNKKHGKGTEIFSDGGKYEGEWKYDNKSGQGTMISSDGGKHEGEWKYGEFRETGRFIEKNVTSNGWVYILINPSLQNSYLKIGMTTRTPEIRAREMSEETGIPGEYDVAHKREVYDCEKVEALVHSELDKFRITSTRNDRSRELFNLSLPKAIATMNKIVDEQNM